jgi:hypothetical protein
LKGEIIMDNLELQIKQLENKIQKLEIQKEFLVKIEESRKQSQERKDEEK